MLDLYSNQLYNIAMNKKAMFIILIALNLLALMIDPFLAGIFVLMWPFWYQQHKAEFE